MKKFLALILAALMMVTMFAACSDEADVEEAIEKFFEDNVNELIEQSENLEVDAHLVTYLSDEEDKKVQEYINERFGEMLKSVADSISYEIIEVEVSGDAATATIKSRGKVYSSLWIIELSGYTEEVREEWGYSETDAYSDIDITMEILEEAFDRLEASIEVKEAEKEIELEKEDGEWVVKK
ncbi:MAG: hypothetical protein IJO09_09455 [Oscillospiraceae bacterium]|nr:hypothetical protein [Oscillospiraceae bacterium]